MNYSTLNHKPRIRYDIGKSPLPLPLSPTLRSRTWPHSARIRRLTITMSPRGTPSAAALMADRTKKHASFRINDTSHTRHHHVLDEKNRGLIQLEKNTQYQLLITEFFNVIFWQEVREDFNEDIREDFFPNWIWPQGYERFITNFNL